VYKRWGESFSDDNQADAYSLEKFGEAYLYVVKAGHMLTPDWMKDGGLTKFQIEAIEKVRAGQ
jgi:hypothetical protein